MVKTTNIDKHGKKRRSKSLITGDCVFPFKYKGQTHYICVDGKDGNWCATSISSRGSVKTWAYCIEDKKIENKGNKINIDDIDVLDEVYALEKDSDKVKKGVIEKKNHDKTIDIRFFDEYKFQPGTEIKYIRKVIKHKKDENEKITKENFDLILSKITFIVSNKPYNSLTFGHSIHKNKDGWEWIIIDLNGEKTYYEKIEYGLDNYIKKRDYWNKKYDIINFEGFDDDLIREKIPELSFIPVDLSTCRYDRSMLDSDIYLKDIPKNKVIKLANGNCYDIDELVQYIISSEGRNVDPMDIVEGLSTPLWNTEDELKGIRDFPTISKDYKNEVDRILNKQLAILQKPPYMDIIKTEKGQEFLKRLLITGKVCSEDYTDDFKPAQIEITRTREYLQENFTDEEIEKLKAITTINGLNIEGVLLKDTGDSCIHGIGFRFSSLYFSAFIKIRNILRLTNDPFNLELFPGVIEIRPNAFIFCHGGKDSNYKSSYTYPLTFIIFDVENMTRQNNSGGAGRILMLYEDGIPTTEGASPWGYSYDFAESQVDNVQQYLKEMVDKNPQNILMQFADRPTGKKLSGKLHQVKDCKKTKKKSGIKIIKKTYKKEGRDSYIKRMKINSDLKIYESHNFDKIRKVLPDGEIIQISDVKKPNEFKSIKIEKRNLHFFLYYGIFVTHLLNTFKQYESEPGNPGLENGVDIDWEKVQIYPEQNNMNYDINPLHHQGLREHILKKSKFKNIYLKKFYFPILSNDYIIDDEGVFELTIIENQLLKYKSEVYYMLTYSGVTSAQVHNIFGSLVSDFNKAISKNSPRIKELTFLTKSGKLKDLIFDYILKGYIDENYGDLEELESRDEVERDEENSNSSKKSNKSILSESSSSNKKSFDSDSFGQKIEEAIDDGRIVIKRKKSDKVFDEIDRFAYKSDSDNDFYNDFDRISPIHTPIDSPMRIEELDLPLRIEDLNVLDSSSSKSNEDNDEFIKSLSKYILNMEKINGEINSIESSLLQIASKYPFKDKINPLIVSIFNKKWDEVLLLSKKINKLDIKIKLIIDVDKQDKDTYEIEINNQSNFNQLFDIILQLTGYTPNNYSLFFDKKKMPQYGDEENASKSLSEYNIHNESIIYLLPKDMVYLYKKKTKKKSSSDKKTHKKDRNIGIQIYEYDEKGRIKNKLVLGKTFSLYKNKMKWSINVKEIKNRYKITVQYDTKTKGLMTKVYWWNPKKIDSNIAPDKLLQNAFNQGYTMDWI